MSNNKDRTDPSEVRGALDSIQKMERAALWRAMPPRWFGAIIALLAGTLVALSAADLREYHVYIILLMACVISYQSQKTRVSVRQFPLKRIGIALMVLLPLFFLLIVAAQASTDIIGPVWAPLFAGIVLAMTMYMLSIFERRWYLAKIGTEKSE